MIRDAIAEVAAAAGCGRRCRYRNLHSGRREDRNKALNGRLGIVGGLSILGTTGVVVPYSCAAWIASIHQGIDVARAAGLDAYRRRDRSEFRSRGCKLYGLSDIALIDMGDFVGGMLKYIRRHPVPRVTIAGGVAKMTKLAQGLTDLHSKRGEVDRALLAQFARAARRFEELAAQIVDANTTAQAFDAGTARRHRLGDAVAHAGQQTATELVTGRDIAIGIVVFDREGALVGHAPFEN